MSELSLLSSVSPYYRGAMGLYEDHVLPRLVAATCGVAALRPMRSEAMEGLRGTVVEIGFGSGSNIGLYPEEVTEVLAVEPSLQARKAASQKAASSAVPVRWIGLDGQAIDLEDESCDAALSTFTLCTVPDPERALAGLYRIVRPGGSLHFLEHGRAPDSGVVRWQERIEPWQKRVAGGCHLTRDAPALISAAGFEVDVVNARYGQGPKPWSWLTWGSATKPAA